MKAGFARVEITPPAGEHPEMMGFGAFLERTALDVLQPIYVRASYVKDQGGNGAVLLAFDLCGLSEELSDRIRRATARAVGLPVSGVITTSTHTHSAPSVMPILGWGEYDEATAERLPSRAAQAAREAKRRAAEVTLDVGVFTLDGFARNRVYGPEGPRDSGLKVLAFRDRRDSRLVGLWTHYSCHPVLLCEQCRVISPDFCGVAMEALESESNGAVCSFLQGSCGDINPTLAHMRQERSIVHLSHFARRFRVAVEQAMMHSHALPDARIAVLRELLSLPVSVLRDDAIEAFAAHARLQGEGWARLSGLLASRLQEAAPRLRRARRPARRVPLAALAVGDLTLLFHPFEMFTQIGLDIQHSLGSERTWVVGYANGYHGYAPTIDRFSPVTGDYAAHAVPLMMGRHPYAPSLPNRLREALVSLGARARA